MIGQAQTGSGKTAAFGLPIIEYVDPDEPEVQALVLTPTRELCIQVTQALRTYGQRKGVDVVAVFGGAPIRTQQAQLRAGGQIVVGTVGRVLDLISRALARARTSCRFVVLDEADEMLDLGFLEDVEQILTLTPTAARPRSSARRCRRRSASSPTATSTTPNVKVQSATLTVDTVEQFQLDVKTADKADKLVEVLRGRAARSGDRLRAHEDPRRPALQDAERPRHATSRRCTATCPRASATA